MILASKLVRQTWICWTVGAKPIRATEREIIVTRQIALEIINHLYGLESSYMQAALEQLGEAALSDRAIRWMAQRQREEQDQKGQRMAAIDRYQQEHPHLSWQDCEDTIEKEGS